MRLKFNLPKQGEITVYSNPYGEALLPNHILVQAELFGETVPDKVVDTECNGVWQQAEAVPTGIIYRWNARQPIGA